VAKALWFIESHSASEVTLTEISDVADISRFHMVRAFGMTTGHSVMRYTSRPKHRLFEQRTVGWYLIDFARGPLLRVLSRPTNPARIPVGRSGR
jgi:AraC-like DNA-binding protein